MTRRRGRHASRQRPPWPDRLALLVLWLLILLPPLVVAPAAKDSFRAPKHLASEILVLASLLLLCFRLRAIGRIDWRMARHPALAAAVPLLAVATLGWLATDHPLHVRQGWTALAIGLAALVGWSLALEGAERRRLLAGTIVPATALSLLVILQFHDLYDPFRFVDERSVRRGLTSLAGGAFDLAAYLVLPALVAQLALDRATSRRARWGWALALAVCLYAMALTQTLTALIALVLGSLVLWACLLPARRLAVAVTVLAVLGGALGLGVEPLRQRVLGKLDRLSAGQINHVLTGRLDGWRAALSMLEHHPWLGVGTGAYTTEFTAVKLELLDAGVEFFEPHVEPHFSSAHSEFLEVAAECGWLGLLALGWGLWVLARELFRKTRKAAPPEGDPAAPDLPLMWSASTALVVLSLTGFPMHLAIVAYPNILLLSAVLAARREVSR